MSKVGRLKIAFAAGILAMLANAVIPYQTFRWLSTAEQASEHSEAIITAANEAFSTLKDAETGQRGFILTGRDEFLQPYDEALREIRPVLVRLVAHSQGLDTLLYFHDYGNMESKTAVRALAALAQETRLGIFRLLVEAGPTGLSAGEIGAELKIAPATLSFHLKELSHAELVVPRQDGRFIFYSTSFDRMNALVAFLTENCCARDGVACAPGAACAPPQAHPAPAAKRKGVKP